VVPLIALLETMAVVQAFGELSAYLISSFS